MKMYGVRVWEGRRVSHHSTSVTAKHSGLHYAPLLCIAMIQHRKRLPQMGNDMVMKIKRAVI